jgi:hypothetical protein
MPWSKIGGPAHSLAIFANRLAALTPDKQAVYTCFYEPAVNRTYAEMAAHYNTAIVPARPYRARDKAKVEVAVQVATRFIIAQLRNRQFFSLSALNAAIAELVTQINNRVSRHLGASRRALFPHSAGRPQGFRDFLGTYRVHPAQLLNERERAQIAAQLPARRIGRSLVSRSLHQRPAGAFACCGGSGGGGLSISATGTTFISRFSPASSRSMRSLLRTARVRC